MIKKPKIDELIKDIPEEQLKILKAVWNHFLQNKEWPKGRSFHHKYGRTNVKNVIDNLNSIFIRYIENPPSGHYKLTTEGVFAIEGAEGPNVKLLLSFLDYQKNKFEGDPEFNETTAQEFMEKVHINSDEARILGEFFDMGNSRLWGNSASNIRSSDWKVGTMKEIELLNESESSLEFLRKQWNGNIERLVTSSPNEVPEIVKTPWIKLYLQFLRLKSVLKSVLKSIFQILLNKLP